MQKLSALFIATLILAACATNPYKDNQPLPPEKLLTSDAGPISSGGYRFTTLNPNEEASGLLVLLSFSGGGKRSSSFGYGVLRGLRDFMIPVNGTERRLLDEIDMITAVSGGTFPAAYYGLYRDKIFTDFEKDFLRRDINGYIWGTYLLPWHYGYLFQPGVGTNDRMARVYDDLMFHGATYADLMRKGRPMVSINSTDVAYEFVFPFTQDYFDLLCSDLTPMPIARAVAASNGFPVVFTPITMRSYREQCRGRVPGWVAREMDPDPLSRTHELAESVRFYLDPQKTKYVHLMDGGIADNLAMRGMINAILVLTSDEDILRQLNVSAIRRIVLISADGQAVNTAQGSTEPTLSSISKVFAAVSGTQIDSYNFETMILAREQLGVLRDALKKLRCDTGPMVNGYACDDVEASLVHLSLDDVTDSGERQHLQQIPTGLTLEDKDIDELVAAGEADVRNSPDLQAFRASLTSRPAS